MDEQRIERCDDCRFWDYLEDAIGECRRYPPVSSNTVQQEEWAKTHGVFAGWFPETNSHEWCGEFSARVPLPMAQECES